MTIKQSPSGDRQAAEDFGLGLKSWRVEHKGMTQREVAALLDVSRETVQAMEAGAPGVALSTWMRAWRCMGVLDAVCGQARLGSHRAGELRMQRIIEQAKARERGNRSECGHENRGRSLHRS